MTRSTMNRRQLSAVSVASLSLLLSMGCGGSPEGEPASLDTQAFPFTAYLNGIACDTSQSLGSTMTPPAVGSNYVDTYWVYPACSAVNSRRWVTFEVNMIACGSADGTGCPKFEVLDSTGAVVKTYTSSSATQYVRIPAPTPDAIFGIRFTQPSWLPSSSATSVKFNVTST
jgi:hypothetical protein